MEVSCSKSWSVFPALATKGKIVFLSTWKKKGLGSIGSLSIPAHSSHKILLSELWAQSDITEVLLELITGNYNSSITTEYIRNICHQNIFDLTSYKVKIYDIEVSFNEQLHLRIESVNLINNHTTEGKFSYHGMIKFWIKWDQSTIIN